MSSFILGTAGHIDHGKTSLVKALTGIDADRLKEEKQRGITIDIGFAHSTIAGRRVGFVDVPGHERFVKNMLAGVSGIDAVLLVVAADESIMPQTREHFDICRLLEIPDGVVVLTKADLVDSDMLELARQEVVEFVGGSFLRNAEIIPISSRTGQGLPELQLALGRLIERLERPDRPQVFRLPIDRVFSRKGFGTVVTGTLISGAIGRDEDIEVYPQGLCCKVRRVESYGQTADSAQAGQRVALNLSGVEVEQLARGMVVGPPGALAPTSLLDVQIQLLPGAAHPLRHRARVRFHHGSSELLARVSLLEGDPLEPGRSAIAQLGLEIPTVALPGDRFILRSYSPMLTIGGGEILDSAPARHRGINVDLAARLATLSGSGLEDRLVYLVESGRQAGIDEENLWRRTGAPRDQLLAALSKLAGAGTIQLVGQQPRTAFASNALKAFEDSTLAALAVHRKQNPLSPGMPREELREKVFDFVSADVLRATLDRLVSARRIDVALDRVNVFGQGVQLSAADQSLKDQIAATYHEARWQPPTQHEVTQKTGADPVRFRKIAHLLVSEKSLARLGEDLLIDRAALEELLRDLRARYPKGSQLAVADFKTLFGLTRKHAIPLLEHLDREKITRRSGDVRVVL
ncbi:MAG: selenocysteine-specific translation elongation factor [Acidobacteriota bacterium]